MSEIKVGSRVQVVSLIEFDKAYGMYVGVTGTVRSIGACSGKPSAYMTWDDHDADDRRVMYQYQLELIEDDEPDLYLYPDTPKGTKIVAIQDTESLLERPIKKGEVFTLAYMSYYNGEYIHVVNPTIGYGNLCVQVEHFMILEDQS